MTVITLCIDVFHSIVPSHADLLHLMLKKCIWNSMNGDINCPLRLIFHNLVHRQGNLETLAMLGTM